MYTETFEKKMKVVLAEMKVTPVNFNIDPVAKRVTMDLDGCNSFTVCNDNLNDVYEHALRIVRGFGPKPTRAKTVKAKATPAIDRAMQEAE